MLFALLITPGTAISSLTKSANIPTEQHYKFMPLLCNIINGRNKADIRLHKKRMIRLLKGKGLLKCHCNINLCTLHKAPQWMQPAIYYTRPRLPWKRKPYSIFLERVCENTACLFQSATI